MKWASKQYPHGYVKVGMLKTAPSLTRQLGAEKAGKIITD
jgi:hypothetical protein